MPLSVLLSSMAPTGQYSQRLPSLQLLLGPLVVRRVPPLGDGRQGTTLEVPVFS